MSHFKSGALFKPARGLHPELANEHMAGLHRVRHRLERCPR
jgi:hypothetical protein